MDHQTFRTQAEQGNILVRIDPVVARWFFTDTGGSAVQRQINEPIPVERTIVKALFIVAPIALFVSFYLAVRAFGWWSLAVIPLSVLVWFVENGAASVESVRVLWPTVVMIGLIFALIYDPSYLCQWWMAVALSMYFSRLKYRLSTFFLRSLVIRNPGAFELLANKIHIAEA